MKKRRTIEHLCMRSVLVLADVVMRALYRRRPRPLARRGKRWTDWVTCLWWTAVYAALPDRDEHGRPLE